MREETLYELETPYRQKFKIRGFRFGEGEKACAMVAAVLRYLSRVGLLRYHCHSGYLSTVVQENEMANVLTPAGGIASGMTNKAIQTAGQYMMLGAALMNPVKTVPDVVD